MTENKGARTMIRMSRRGLAASVLLSGLTVTGMAPDARAAETGVDPFRMYQVADTTLSPLRQAAKQSRNWIGQRRPDLSLQVMETALRQHQATADDGDLATAYMEQGLALVFLTDYRRAARILTRAEQIAARMGHDPDFDAPLLASALEQARSLARTFPPVPDNVASLRDDPEITIRVEAARDAWFQDKDDLAEKQFEQVRRQAPNHKGLNQNYGLFLVTRGRLTTAQLLFNRLLYLSYRQGNEGFYGLALDGIARLTWAEGEISMAADLFRAAIPKLRAGGLGFAADQVELVLRSNAARIRAAER